MLRTQKKKQIKNKIALKHIQDRLNKIPIMPDAVKSPHNNIKLAYSKQKANSQLEQLATQQYKDINKENYLQSVYKQIVRPPDYNDPANKAKRMDQHLQKYMKKLGLHKSVTSVNQKNFESVQQPTNDNQPNQDQYQLKIKKKKQSLFLPKMAHPNQISKALAGQQNIASYSQENQVDLILNSLNKQQKQINNLDYKFFKKFRNQNKMYKKLNQKVQKFEEQTDFDQYQNEPVYQQYFSKLKAQQELVAQEN
eukprot:TRINITY_DN28947_c0_g1_i1.p1 TRINITY_DN28947_c0_g1~~TRINITY_DN28947_c0_g1_i1.p1  ORF type:complete len:252 (-),score=45.31 TRINITY_DN28947_c0_g1_i1:99-854(-)